jgi:AcrR family transcriptional regulator
MKSKTKPLKTNLKSKKKATRAGRPRSSASHDAILNASLTLLKKKGYRSVTIEGIASEAAVGKQTIYRWWKSKAEVILEAFARHTASQVIAPDSGALKTDLQFFLEQAFDLLTREYGEIVRGLMSEAIVDQDFAKAMRDIFIDSRRNALKEILLKGIERGELASNLEIEFVIDLIYGPMWYRLLNRHAPLNSKFAGQISELITEKLT